MMTGKSIDSKERTINIEVPHTWKSPTLRPKMLPSHATRSPRENSQKVVKAVRWLISWDSTSIRMEAINQNKDNAALTWEVVLSPLRICQLELINLDL